MKIILLQSVKGLGEKGEIKETHSGYARNFLIPNKLAKLATQSAINDFNEQKERAKERIETLSKQLDELQASASASPPIFFLKVGDKGEVFSSISSIDIAKKLAEEYPVFKKVNLKIETDHIRKLGRHQIKINLGQGIKGVFTIEVQPQQS